MSGWRPSRLDALLALAVSVAGVVEAFGRAGPGPGQVHRPALVALGAVLAGTILALRRRYPVAALLALTALSATLRLTVMDADYPLAAWQFYSYLILVHTVGSGPATGWRRAGGLLAVLAAYAWLQTLPGQDVAESLIGAIFMGVAYGSGILLRRQTERTVLMAERAAVAAGAERSRIARELHDVISHNVNLMTLNAGAVRLLLGADEARQRERDLLSAVERSGRDTLDELRLMLGILRDGAVAPGLGHLDRLADPLRAAGLDVRIRTSGAARPLPPALDLSAYRLVQESLTNALKHADAAAVTVDVTYTAGTLTIEVTDDGRAAVTDTAADAETGAESGAESGVATDAGAGHGLAGMRERVALHGGAFAAGPRAGGGYTVTATLPLAAGE